MRTVPTTSSEPHLTKNADLDNPYSTPPLTRTMHEKADPPITSPYIPKVAVDLYSEMREIATEVTRTTFYRKNAQLTLFPVAVMT